MEEQITISQLIWIIVIGLGILTSILGIFTYVNKRKKDIADDAESRKEVDHTQDLELIKLKGEVRANTSAIAELKGSYNALEGKLVKQIEKLEKKIDNLSNTIIQNFINKN